MFPGLKYLITELINLGLNLGLVQAGSGLNCRSELNIGITKSYKYLGIIINTFLNCKEQAQRATTNATKWILQYQRLTKPSTGVKIKLMQQLYLAVALPKITYSIDTWYTPPNKKEGQSKYSGSVTFLRNLTKIQ